MSGSSAVVDIVSEAVNSKAVENTPSDLSLEALALLINAERLHHLENKVLKEFSDLKKRQDAVIFLHKLIKTINLATNSKGELDCTGNQELINLLKTSKSQGVEINDSKMKYDKDERDRLLENIRMSIDDYNILNDMQLQTITRLTNERYESYQMARTIMKPLHDDKINKARSVSSR